VCTTTGVQNTAIGSCALRLNSTGCFLSALGVNALADQTTAIYNTALGFQGALRTTTGGCNTAVGALSFQCNTTGNSNIAIGFVALCANVEGDQSVAIGNEALRNQNPVGNVDMNNVAVGYQAACATTTGTSNTAVGACSLRLNETGGGNASFGFSALCGVTTGGNNTAVGNQALLGVSTGSNNTAIGSLALCGATGSNNIGIGRNAGRTGSSPEGIVNITTESNRIVMGNDDHTCAQIKIAWTATSDCRDKTCFKPIAHGLDFVRALKPTEYQFKQGGRDSAETDGKRRYGFLAQDILPLEGDAPVIISADNPEKLQYTESHLIPILVKAIQELTARVEELENNA
jgi:trimeric autotransporter adhesin